ncbi:lipase family protein [Parachitinimonas caeni]|uniref:Alpha/beta hydrolase n=1 Tax=Parachitinimonas caeni TaxID=3031301 RepID=A0ABT7DZT3_9NEIS|nr:hypothetical protein [Parachitinimonas caeni]MDK2125504.1 hypothetical protein [Parachitinimonas caeni]
MLRSRWCQPDLGAWLAMDGCGEFRRLAAVVASDRHTSELRPGARDPLLVLWRGLFGAWLPGHFQVPLQILRDAGWICRIAPSAGGGTIAANAARVARWLDESPFVGTSQRPVILLCHSKGGLEALELCRTRPDWAARVSALVFCQTPRSGCPLLEDLARPSGIRERSQARALRVMGAWTASQELTTAAISQALPEWDGARPAAPLICVASWSDTPGWGIEAQHSRMAKRAPGHLHDGLFFLDDQLWPVSETIILKSVNHSQPTLGSQRFPLGQLWLTLAALAARRGEASVQI